MPKFRAVVVSLALSSFGRASQLCHPAYSPGAAYSEGTSVSQLITAVTPVVWTACAVSPTCTTGWTQTGGVATTGTYNYLCISPFWCGNVGYAPGGVYSDLAWKREADDCSVRSAEALFLALSLGEFRPTASNAPPPRTLLVIASVTAIEQRG
jgi:hypothetical protein